MSARTYINCACCQKPGHAHGRNLIKPCYNRHRDNGTLHRYPLTMRRVEPWQPTSRHGRRMLDRYQALAAIRPTPSVARIAFELGVSDRQVWRYAAAIRAEEQNQQPRTEAA